MERFIHLWREPGTGWGLTIWATFAAACTLMAILSRERPLVAVGRVMNQTATVRVAFKQEDRAATDQLRQDARQRTPRIYVADTTELQELGVSLQNLPATLVAAETIQDVAPDIRDKFGLTAERLAAVQAQTIDGEPTKGWIDSTDQLYALLLQRPILDGQTFQREWQSLNKEIQLMVEDRTETAISSEIINGSDPAKMEREVAGIVRQAGFSGPLLAVVTARLLYDPKPTFRFDSDATTKAQDQAAHLIAVVERDRVPGQVIFTRGDVLQQEVYDLYGAELREYVNQTEAWKVWLRRASIAGAVLAVTGAIAGYSALFLPRIRRNPAHGGGIAALLAGALGLACWGTVTDPGLLTLTAIAPTVFVAVILGIAYDRRVALGYGALHGLLVCTSLDQPIGIYALMITGIGVAVWSLREVRDRTSLVRMTAYQAAALAVGTILVALIDRPLVEASLRQTLVDAGLAGFGGLLAGGVTIFILPTIERWFGITTSMTLIELRDPKHPLLRELQQRAPGTYNHSLNVANLAEAAAEAVGGSGLLAYVGALYHDVGKMNKPDYFVENQTPGINRHDKLSPAMSLLVIVGHVKDGLELAREHGIPEPIHHFIEAHHGTTLVEYFFHRARMLAASGGSSGGGIGAGAAASGNGNGSGNTHGDLSAAPEEIEYRYPGPKPRTREVAIVMLCDAVESASRSMSSPTPSRIEAVVRALATKRLMDGQFDDCDLTLRELNTIVEAISKTLAAIYHGRVAYPQGNERAGEPKTTAVMPQPLSSGGSVEARAPQPAQV
ncbi:MAG: HDIG domain-containing protein [Phycisphaerales bacterium]|nr:HDIG domain-containing protein [Phycisphaerales bacterium]